MLKNFFDIRARIKLIIYLSLDIVSYLIILFLFKKNLNNLDFNLYFLNYLILWLLTSYLLGRYEKNGHLYYKKINFSLTKHITQITLSTLITLVLNIPNEGPFTDILIINNYLLIKVILIFSITTFLLDTISNNYLFKKDNQKNFHWYFLGNKEKINKLRKDLSEFNNAIMIDKIEQNELDKILKKKDFKKRKFIFSDDVKTSKETINKLIYLRRKGNFILSDFEWYEEVLKRIDPDLVKNEDIISKRISTSQNIQKRFKRFSDIIISLLLLFITFPLLIISGILIKLEDSGPIIYKQIRTGLFGKEFYIYKLRSMYQNAEKGIPQWSKKGDKRITKIGHFLRKSRIDELPQLINVLNGEMSLIGPRPERPIFEESLEKNIPCYKVRHYAKPGISGWAQVNYPYGASIEDAKNKLSYDLYYMKNYSVWLDILIIFKTIKLVILLRGSTPKN